MSLGQVPHSLCNTHNKGELHLVCTQYGDVLQDCLNLGRDVYSDPQSERPWQYGWSKGHKLLELVANLKFCAWQLRHFCMHTHLTNF